jgi:hypothetical protein
LLLLLLLLLLVVVVVVVVLLLLLGIKQRFIARPVSDATRIGIQRSEHAVFLVVTGKEIISFMGSELNYSLALGAGSLNFSDV